MKKLLKIYVFILILLGCTEVYKPKPTGYFRISLPDTIYQEYDNMLCPYTFEYNQSATIKAKQNQPCWEDIEFKSIHGVIQLTYKPVKSNLDTLLRDAKEFAFKHGVKADGISETLYIDTARRIFGIFYEIYGNTATNYQFFVTDSTRHFLRGTAYVHSQPNIDSTGPVTHFLGNEIRHIVETLRWK
ncbi:MAG: gliding motility lipoprotein GldD [Thermaurantimonas sp.]|uniref:gliding motility lipoprotein GldD n=1 Tax=Thermaurantimonas sp. TaxID=2681568 RepID=UPI00391BF9A7